MNGMDVDSVEVVIGDQILLNNVSFHIEKGEVVALLGHNGAGKSTLLRTIMGMLDKKKGTIQVCGHDLDTSFIDYKKQIAYLPEEPMLLSELTVYQHFQMYGLAYGISEETLTKRIETYVEGFELTGKLDKYPEELSKGMRQKVQGICAFLPDAPLLLIDEPFMGLDIYAIDYIEELMRQKISEGVTIFISSHQLERIRDLADSFILLQKGEVIRQGPINEFDTIKRGSDT